MVSALRLVIDHEQATILAGNQADLGKLNVAVQSLIALLPGRELPAPEANRPDPRQVMWLIYKQMRERGEINLKPLPPEDHFQHRIAELEAELATLKGGSVPALPDVPPAVERVVIDPGEGDITPPSEIGRCHVGIERGPDDPPPRSLSVIEAKAVRLSPTKQPAARPQQWDDTPGGKAWRAWHDAGGGGGSDPWANNNR
jgi:hypothetical protein